MTAQWSDKLIPLSIISFVLSIFSRSRHASDMLLNTGWPRFAYRRSTCMEQFAWCDLSQFIAGSLQVLFQNLPLHKKFSLTVFIDIFDAVDWEKGIWPIKNWVVGAVMVICLGQGADLHMAQLMPLPLTVSCFSKIHLGFTFLVPAHLGSPGQRVIKRVFLFLFCHHLETMFPQHCAFLYNAIEVTCFYSTTLK